MNTTQDTHDPIDDPRLTAYALGELQGDEARNVETLIENDASAKQFVDEIRATAQQIHQALEGETPETGLGQRRRAEIERAIQGAGSASSPILFRFGVPAAVAASIAGLLWIGNLLSTEGDRAEVAMNTAQSAPEHLGNKVQHAEKRGKTEPLPPASVADASRPKAGASTPRSVAAVDSAVKAKDASASSALPGEANRNAPAGAAPPPVASAPVAEAGPAKPAAPPAPQVALAPMRKQADEFRAASSRRSLSGGSPAEGLAAQNGVGRVQRDDVVAPEPPIVRPIPPERERRYRPLPVPVAPQSDNFENTTDNPFMRPSHQPRSTFSIDVDTASYAIVRRFLTQNRMLPPAGAVRIEEMVNYFAYDYTAPEEGELFVASYEVASAPWKPEHRLVRIGLRAKDVTPERRPAANLVFLIDVSGSMRGNDKLPLLKKSMLSLINELRGDDRIAIVTYASGTQVVLPSTDVAEEKQKIVDTINGLNAGGSTNGGAGLQMAYATAAQHFVEGGVNRVLLASDGDFNVGITDTAQLEKLIEDKRKTGVYLSVLGFGQGNLKDGLMERLSNKGNGNYAYIDTWREGHKVLVEQATSTLQAVAKDVKIRVEFNPAKVAAYRLIGYANRKMASKDFTDDSKDAGEIGSGHTVTAFYEVIPTGVDAEEAGTLRYRKPEAQAEAEARPAPHGDELCFVELRYQGLDGGPSRQVSLPVKDGQKPYAEASQDFRFASAVASFGMLLRGSPFKGQATYDQVMSLAAESVGQDPGGLRREFVELVRQAQSISGRR